MNNNFDCKKANINFKAIPIANFTTKAVDELGAAVPKVVSIFEAEPKDSFIFADAMAKMDKVDLIPSYESPFHKLIHKIDASITLGECVSMLDKMKSVSEPLFQKTKIFFGVSDGEFCGVAVANIPKISSDNQIVFSTRAKPGETELDMLFTNLTSKREKLKGLGKIFVAQVYDFFRDSDFNSLYIRSELPESSPFSLKTYESMGATAVGEPIAWKPSGYSRSLFSQNVTESSEYNDVLVQPMSIGKKSAARKVKEIFSQFGRESLSGKSIHMSPVADV